MEGTGLRVFVGIYLEALLNGNPIAIGATVIAAVALSLGAFKQGLTSGDPAAIGLAVFVILGIVILLTLGIVDRRNEAPRKKGRSKDRSTRR